MTVVSLVSVEETDDSLIIHAIVERDNGHWHPEYFDFWESECVAEFAKENHEDLPGADSPEDEVRFFLDITTPDWTPV